MNLKTLFYTVLASLWMTTGAHAQTLYIPADSSAPDLVSFTLSGGSFQNYGCTGIDPAYWFAGYGVEATIHFVHAQSHPSVRVWGMNEDDQAQIFVNGAAYPLDSVTASYNEKVICNIFGSPGPDGVLFDNGLLVGANSNAAGNYSYQDVTLLTNDVDSIKILGISGAGWGFAGVTVQLDISGLAAAQVDNESLLFPNPIQDVLNIHAPAVAAATRYLVRNVTGDIVLSGWITLPDAAVDVSNLVPGLYLLTIGTDVQQNFRVIKK